MEHPDSGSGPGLERGLESVLKYIPSKSETQKTYITGQSVCSACSVIRAILGAAVGFKSAEQGGQPLPDRGPSQGAAAGGRTLSDQRGELGSYTFKLNLAVSERLFPIGL